MCDRCPRLFAAIIGRQRDFRLVPFDRGGLGGQRVFQHLELPWNDWLANRMVEMSTDAAQIALAWRDRIDPEMRETMERIVDGIEGPIAGLVNCAAIYHPKPFLELDEANWDDHLGINLKGTLFASQAVLPRLRAQKRGSIVMFSSGVARTGAAFGVAYAATKGGVLGLARMRWA